VRSISPVYGLFGLAAVCAMVLGLSGCTTDDDDDGVGTPSATVEGLVDTPATMRPVSPPVLTAQSAIPDARLRLATYEAPAPTMGAELSTAETDQAAEDLAAAMAAAVPGAVHLSPAQQAALIALGQGMAAADHLFIQQPQLVLIVDRGPRAQVLAVTLARPDGDWRILGASHVSTGKPGRLQHFRTPVGVLLNDGSEIGYRAQGTFNQNHIRGLGVKGMRVWDFGWQTTDDWRTPGATMEVRVEMHATDPTVLEQRIGRADSEGCIRLPDALNRFLDRHGVIDAAIERLGETDGGYRALLSPELDPTPLAGDAVIVVDSSEPWIKPYPPETSIALSD
jgi:lipoprotein-anchoring transpeptidase ErfK/SrfK